MNNTQIAIMDIEFFKKLGFEQPELLYKYFFYYHNDQSEPYKKLKQELANKGIDDNKLEEIQKEIIGFNRQRIEEMEQSGLLKVPKGGHSSPTYKKTGKVLPLTNFDYMFFSTEKNTELVRHYLRLYEQTGITPSYYVFLNTTNKEGFDYLSNQTKNYDFNMQKLTKRHKARKMILDLADKVNPIIIEEKVAYINKVLDLLEIEKGIQVPDDIMVRTIYAMLVDKQKNENYLDALEYSLTNGLDFLEAIGENRELINDIAKKTLDVAFEKKAEEILLERRKAERRLDLTEKGFGLAAEVAKGITGNEPLGEVLEIAGAATGVFKKATGEQEFNRETAGKEVKGLMGSIIEYGYNSSNRVIKQVKAPKNHLGSIKGEKIPNHIKLEEKPLYIQFFNQLVDEYNQNPQIDASLPEVRAMISQEASNYVIDYREAISVESLKKIGDKIVDYGLEIKEVNDKIKKAEADNKKNYNNKISVEKGEKIATYTTVLEKKTEEIRKQQEEIERKKKEKEELIRKQKEAEAEKKRIEKARKEEEYRKIVLEEEARKKKELAEKQRIEKELIEKQKAEAENTQKQEQQTPEQAEETQSRVILPKEIVKEEPVIESDIDEEIEEENPVVEEMLKFDGDIYSKIFPSVILDAFTIITPKTEPNEPVKVFEPQKKEEQPIQEQTQQEEVEEIVENQEEPSIQEAPLPEKQTVEEPQQTEEIVSEQQTMEQPEIQSQEEIEEKHVVIQPEKAGSSIVQPDIPERPEQAKPLFQAPQPEKIIAKPIDTPQKSVYNNNNNMEETHTGIRYLKNLPDYNTGKYKDIEGIFRDQIAVDKVLRERGQK